MRKFKKHGFLDYDSLFEKTKALDYQLGVITVCFDPGAHRIMIEVGQTCPVFMVGVTTLNVPMAAKDDCIRMIVKP